MTPICEASAVSLMKPIKNINTGGRITFQACGMMTSHRVLTKPKFIAADASHWVWWTDSKPARTISAMNAVEMKHKPQRATLNMGISILKTLKEKNTRKRTTSGGTRLKNSTKAVAATRNGKSVQDVVTRVAAIKNPARNPMMQLKADRRIVTANAFNRKMAL